jgi:hypothetical protein
MRMPGFAAEAAIYASRNHYALTHRGAAGSSRITPQLIRCPRGTSYQEYTECFDVCSPDGTCQEKCVKRKTCVID